jgi:hypothetical protein
LLERSTPSAANPSNNASIPNESHFIEKTPFL